MESRHSGRHVKICLRTSTISNTEIEMNDGVVVEAIVTATNTVDHTVDIDA